jgi:Ubiquitin carboxyl-terminal hydrolase
LSCDLLKIILPYRFSIEGKKIGKGIKLNERINLNRYKSRVNGANQRGANYRLVAGVNHLGHSAQSGHYTTLAYAPNNNLYLYDDGCVSILWMQTRFWICFLPHISELFIFFTGSTSVAANFLWFWCLPFDVLARAKEAVWQLAKVSQHSNPRAEQGTDSTTAWGVSKAIHVNCHKFQRPVTQARHHFQSKPQIPSILCAWLLRQHQRQSGISRQENRQH